MNNGSLFERGKASADPLVPSIRTLCGPIKTDSPPSISELYRKAQSLAFFLEHGDRKTRTVAEALAYRMIYEAMVASLYNSSRGAIPRFVDQIRNSEKIFEEILR